MANPEFFPVPNWSPLYEPPKHLFVDVQSIYILCRAAGSTTELLPFPLEPVPGSDDLFRFTFTKVGKIYTPTVVSRNILMLEVGLPVRYGDETAAHNSIEYIDVDFGMSVGREDYGWPKKMANFSWTEEENGRIHGEARRNGYSLVHIDFEPSREAAADHTFPDWFEAPYLQVRSIDRAPEVSEKYIDVLRSNIPGFVLHSSVAGKASLSLFDGPTDPLSFLGPIEILAARLDTYDFEFDWADVVDTVQLPNPEEYLDSQQTLSRRLRTEAGFPPEAYRLTVGED